MKIEKNENGANLIWKDRKRYFGLPISFTIYGVYDKPDNWTKLFVQTGLLHTKVEELHIYRIDDISVNQTLWDKIFGVGSIKVYCQDASANEVTIKCVKNPYKVRSMLNDLVEASRTNKRIVFGELQ
ncbi:MAG: PH domain-containing protein [Clostridia bacterium]|nr:PH domain-containing protein [Clostridia bacterium]